ncbi:unnamed protein product [Caenorhabditis auriculariae]|uniref:BED-type domain-containing protein n=1 Tax=Caenorhabditis auriculariae TaxID=2777116 RepID=A0A8S1GRR6_9PELO|nr:unnamed protein product [Caenorhabditis auriculariae]
MARKKQQQPSHSEVSAGGADKVKGIDAIVGSQTEGVENQEEEVKDIDFLALLNASGIGQKRPSPATNGNGAPATKVCKKTSEIWDHYKLLSENQNVECSYCWKVLRRNDSSTKTMWGHLQAFHSDVIKGSRVRKSQKLLAAEGEQVTPQSSPQTPTQPYVKRARAGGNNNNSQQERTTADSLASAMQQLQQSGHLGTYNTSLNFLDNLPKSNEVINIGAGFIKDDDEDNHNTEAGSSTASEEQHLSTSPLRDEAVASPHVSASANSLGSLGDDSQANNNNQFAAFMNIAAANPMMLAMLGSAANVMNATTTTTATSSGATTCVSASASTSPPSPPHLPNASNGVPFTLSEGSCASVLMSMAVDLDMTLSYHRRRVDVELCFESNRTAEKSGGRGKIICLTDLGKEIRITERINGAVVDTEMWTKTDFNQFHWAIRGKCQKAFIKA